MEKTKGKSTHPSGGTKMTKTKGMCWWAVGILAVVAFLTVQPATVKASHLKENPKRHKIVYHLNEPGVEKAKAVLGNIRNHIKGVKGWDNIEALELVVHGAALKAFLRKDMDPEVRRALETLQTEGMGFGACGNTIKGLQITLADLADGAKELPQGGVVRVMELQEQGYAYVKP
jgi:intracellular sulfur oxidation DsrE/DsrF family protein